MDMGFDKFIYIVRIVEDGHVLEYEFGNLKHALEMYLSVSNAQLIGYENGEEELLR